MKCSTLGILRNHQISQMNVLWELRNTFEMLSMMLWALMV